MLMKERAHLLPDIMFLQSRKKKFKLVLHHTSPRIAKRFQGREDTKRKPVLQKLKRSFNQTRLSMKMFVSKPKAANINKLSLLLSFSLSFSLSFTLSLSPSATAASFAVSHNSMKSKWPSSDGGIVKDAFLAAAEFIFADFTNKNKIFPAIADLQLSRRRVSRSLENIAADISAQLKGPLSHANSFLSSLMSLAMLQICFVVGRPGVRSLSQVIPKDFKKWYLQLLCLVLSIKKG